MNTEKFEARLYISEANKRKRMGYTWKHHLDTVTHQLHLFINTPIYSYSLQTKYHSHRKKKT